MYTLFLFCAVTAGSIFVLQFILLLIGMGGESAEFHVDMPDAGHADFDITDGSYDTDGDGLHDHGSTFLFGVISMRTVVAAVTFFGLAGIASLEAEQSQWIALPISLIAGAGAMFVVHFLMRSLSKLSQDGKLRIRNAVGKIATVYIPIAAHNGAPGKIQIRIQGRLEELAAMNGTPDTLATGTNVRVIGVVSSSVVQVEPIHAKEAIEAEANVST